MGKIAEHLEKDETFLEAAKNYFDKLFALEGENTLTRYIGETTVEPEALLNTKNPVKAPPKTTNYANGNAQHLVALYLRNTLQPLKSDQNLPPGRELISELAGHAEDYFELYENRDSRRLGKAGLSEENIGQYFTGNPDKMSILAQKAVLKTLGDACNEMPPARHKNLKMAPFAGVPEENVPLDYFLKFEANAIAQIKEIIHEKLGRVFYEEDLGFLEESQSQGITSDTEEISPL